MDDQKSKQTSAYKEELCNFRVNRDFYLFYFLFVLTTKDKENAKDKSL